MKLTKFDVLQAVVFAAGPRSNYIKDHLRRGGFPVSAAVVLSRLKALSQDGHLQQSRFPDGYYGYTWIITDAGRAALAERSEG